MKQTIEDPSLLDRPPGTVGRISEFDLFAWAQGCWINRWKILATICVAAIAVTALNLAKPAMYRSTALISLSKSAEVYFEQNQTAVFWPNEDPVAQIADRHKIDISADRVSVGSSFNRIAANLAALEISVQASSPKTARRMVEGVAKLFVKRSAAVDSSLKSLASLRKSQSEALKVFDQKAKILDREKRQLTARYRSLSKTISESKTDAVSFAILNHQLDQVTGDRTIVENQSLDIDLTRLAYKDALAARSLNEGKIELLSVSAAKRVPPGLTADAVFAGLAAFLISIIVIFVRQNR